ncbi:MAG TPA: prephenate dehydrogenase [Gemmatimonadales bacterium]|jgi:prephenate dehydrogenase|nr:prephenate dehydrogenase [Gemmatimonadales bacterium]
MRPSSLAVIGLGAIGGSLAWQSRLAGVARVIGYSPNPAEGVQALKVSAITELADTPARAVRGAELVVLATPPQPTLDLLAPVASALEPGAFFTDVCSIKAPVIRRAVAAGIGDRFAGSHPLAGTHETGFASAVPERFRGCVVYICETGAARGHLAAGVVASFWEETLEASPVYIGADAHDQQLAWTSHLPQAVAFALAKVLADQQLGGVSFGSGARDTLRLAASNPDMWVDILRYNRESLEQALARTEDGLAELRRLIAAGDTVALHDYLETARRFRQGIER